MAERRLTADAAASGARLDRWLAARVPALSRARVQALIDEGRVRVDGSVRKRAYRLAGGERIVVDLPPPPLEALEPEPIALSVVHEDPHILVIDKPVGMVVHPGAGHARGTLAAAALAHAPAVAGVGGPRRPGIVHRLDKDTSGLLVLAKSAVAYERLVAQLAARTMSRTYLAIIHGRLRADRGVIEAPLGRHPHDRVRMAVLGKGKGKPAVTRYRVLERFSQFSYVEVTLETGRTHQIRVHMAALGHPVVGDSLYGGRARRALPAPLAGHALHAARLRLVHPVSGEPMEFVSPLPARMGRLLSHLRSES